MRLHQQVRGLGILLIAGGLQYAWADGIGGLVVDCNGQPAAGAFVMITKKDGTFVRKGYTTGNGSFQFDILDDGPYDVKVVCANGKIMETPVVLHKGGQIRLQFRCPCTPRMNGMASGVEGAWKVQGTAFDTASLRFDVGSFELVVSAGGRTVQGKGIYRQVESNPSHRNDVVAAVYQGTGIVGAQLLMAEVDVCGDEATKEMHGSSPLFATVDNPFGMFVASRDTTALTSSTSVRLQ